MAKLSDRAIKAAKTPGLYGDGLGLYLRVSRGAGHDAAVSRSWMLRVMAPVDAQKRRVEMGLGGYPDVGLAAAREQAAHWRSVAKGGANPLDVRAAASKPAMTFEQAARRVWADRIEGVGKNGKHKQQWINTLVTYAFPVIGDLPVATVGSADIVRVLKPIWQTKAETAKRVRQRMAVVFDWAIFAGEREKASPLVGLTAGLEAQVRKVQHHRSLPWDRVPAAMADLSQREGMGALALRLLILTACRSGEIRGADWSEINLEGRVWSIPADRMKAGKTHRVPLSGAAVAVLAEAAAAVVGDCEPYDLGGMSGLVFPGQNDARKPLSDMSLSAVTKRMKLDAVPHGFRSSFRVWAAEKSGEAREVLEMCLAHEVGSAVEQAYARSDLFERRRVVMDAWATWCIEGCASVGGNVVDLAGATAAAAS